MNVVSFYNLGAVNTPREVKNLRRANLGSVRHLGAPVVWRHVYSLQDVVSGVAKQCPACFDTTYQQARSDCPVCYGQGFVSVEDNPDPLWIDADGLIIESESQPSGTIRAPRYGGFGQPWITWVVQPDISVDVFRLNEQGALTQQYDATAYAPWYPTMGDNDLLVNVNLEGNNFDIASTEDRFQLKQVHQVTTRGLGNRGRPAPNGQPFLIMQSFEMNKIPVDNPLMNVPVDEPWY